jgi:hypothetical protein
VAALKSKQNGTEEIPGELKKETPSEAQGQDDENFRHSLKTP